LVTIVNSLIYKNTVWGISTTVLAHTITNCTICLNAGGGIIAYGQVISSEIKNSIIFGNTGYQILGWDGTPFVGYCDVQGGYAGPGNINVNPGFVDPANDNFRLVQPPCQASLSACVDAGDPDFSMIGGSTRTDRVQDQLRVDMGYHYTPACIDFDAYPDTGEELLSNTRIDDIWASCRVEISAVSLNSGYVGSYTGRPSDHNHVLDNIPISNLPKMIEFLQDLRV